MKRAVFWVACVLLTGCQQKYYKVTDVQTGQDFYTKGWLDGMYGRNGQIGFKELGTDHKIVLQSSHVEEVGKEQAIEAAQMRSE